MAALIQSLYFAGSRLSTGAPNDSGTVYAYIPGTTNHATLYSDADATTAITQPITLDSGGRIPYSTYPDGVWITAPVRLVVQDVDGNTVSDAAFWPADARDTALVNDGFTGDTVDAALSALFDSTGGQDALYKESGGATERPIQDKFREIWISVKDFGAAGNGLATDTVPIQEALNRAATLGAVCYFPPGTYLIDQALTITNATQVTVRGAGMALSIVASTNSAANGFTVSGCTNITFEDLDIIHATTSTGAAILLSSSATPSFLRVGCGFTTTSAVWTRSISATGSGTPTLRDCILYATTEAVLLSSCIDARVFGGLFSGDTYAINFAGTTYGHFFGMRLASSGIARFTSGLTGVEFDFVGCTVTSYSVAAANMPAIRQSGGTPQRSSTSGATGAAQTPSLLGGPNVSLSATSGGAGTVTVNSPAILPASNSLYDGLTWTVVLNAAAGGNVTFDFSASPWKVAGGTTIVVNDGHTASAIFRWDTTTGKLRQMTAIADTVT